MDKHPIFGIVLLQIAFAAIMAGAIFMGKKAETGCKPSHPPALKDCRPYPEAGPRAMSCTWPQGKPVNPWAPMRSCDE